ncbi:MAG: N-acetyltransferase [Spirochaetota bacterium]|nr:N-acetyltransferase [Spirochaetota bacterium]
MFPSEKIILHEENPHDRPEIFRLNTLAFQGDSEAKLVDSLRQSGAIVLSLVACQGDTIVGHIAFSNAQIESVTDSFPTLVLAPMAVLPGFQRQGIGSLLIERSIKILKARNHSSILVLGHRDYYPAFGFRLAKDYQITCQFQVPRESFMALELYPDALKAVTGKLIYHEAFHRL